MMRDRRRLGAWALVAALWSTGGLAGVNDATAVDLVGPGSAAGTSIQVARWRGQELELGHLVRTGSGSGWLMDLPCELGWTYQLGSESVYRVPFGFDEGDCTGTKAVAIDVEVGGQISFRLDAKGQRLPEFVEVAFHACDSLDGLVHLRYPVNAQGAVLASLPVGCADASLTAGRFGSVSLSGVQVQAGLTNDLGVVRLEQGGSIEARVVEMGGSRPLAGVRLALISEEAWQSAAQRALAGEHVAAWRSDVSGSDGVLRVDGLRRGRVGIIVESTDARYAVRAIAPVSIEPGQSVVLGTIGLPEAALLNLHVEPGPSTEPGLGYPGARVLVKAAVGCVDGQVSARILEISGPVTGLRVAPGSWVLEAQGRGPSGSFEPWLSEKLDLLAGEVRVIEIRESEQAARKERPRER